MIHSCIACVLVYTIFFMYPHSGDCAEIIGGKEVAAHSLPFMALLKNRKGKSVCGGVLIKSKWVLTAAHCSDIKTVLLGVHSIKAEEKDTRQIRKVTACTPHPCYDPTDKVNDIMLLKLDKPVKKTKSVRSLPLPPPVADLPGGTKCVVAGWGATKNGKSVPMSNVLRSANVTVIDRVTCNSPDFYNFTPIITHSMLCAGSVGSNTADSCQGDSGGPLLCGDVFKGVTSFGGVCGSKNHPGVYTFLSKKYIDWIEKTTRKSD